MAKRGMCLAVLTICSVLAVSVAARSETSQGARLSGWTLTTDGQPLAGVEVVLACPATAPARRTQSDDRGRFELMNLPPANCRLWGTKRGYVDANVEGDAGLSGAYSLRVNEGAWRDGFELRLARGAVLTGRIQNYQGKEARNIRVHPIRREVANGVTKLVPLAYTRVDPSGRFEFGTRPAGEYYVAASPLPEGSDAGGRSGYGWTYYPGSAKLANAHSFMLKAGDARDVEFPLSTTPAFAVSGIVHDVEGRPVPDASVGLSFETEPKWMTGSTRTRPDGTFVVTGVFPGSYVLQAGRGLTEIGEVRFDVDAADVANVVVRIVPRR